MQQTFRATIFNGILSASENCTALELVILQTVKRKHRNGQFMRFLLAELLECQFIPSLLPGNQFSPLLDALTDHDTRLASTVEINAVNFNGPYSPQIIATAEFVLPVKYKMLPMDWTYEMSVSKALEDAVRFYWTWRDSPPTTSNVITNIEDAYHQLIGDTIAFEMVER